MRGVRCSVKSERRTPRNYSELVAFTSAERHQPATCSDDRIWHRQPSLDLQVGANLGANVPPLVPLDLLIRPRASSSSQVTSGVTVCSRLGSSQ